MTNMVNSRPYMLKIAAIQNETQTTPRSVGERSLKPFIHSTEIGQILGFIVIAIHHVVSEQISFRSTILPEPAQRPSCKIDCGIRSYGKAFCGSPW